MGGSDQRFYERFGVGEGRGEEVGGDLVDDETVTGCESHAWERGRGGEGLGWGGGGGREEMGGAKEGDGEREK